MKKTGIFSEMYYAKHFWWRKGDNSPDFELGTGETLGAPKCKLERGEKKVQ